MRIEPGLTGYMTERGMRWHVIRADGTHEMQDASGRPFVRVKAWRKPNEDGRPLAGDALRSTTAKCAACGIVYRTSSALAASGRNCCLSCAPEWLPFAVGFLSERHFIDDMRRSLEAR